MLVNHLRGGKLTQIPQKLIGQEVGLNETMELLLKFLKWACASTTAPTIVTIASSSKPRKLSSCINKARVRIKMPEIPCTTSALL